MNYKWTVLIGIVVVAIAGICGYVLFSQKAPTQTTSQTGTPTSTVPNETYGMSEYTDSAYGFSFWYPSALQVTAAATKDSVDFPGGVAVETLQIGSAGDTSIVVVNSPSSSITDEAANHASPIAQTKYFYDSTSGQWMVAYPQGTNNGGSAAPAAADVSKTTIAGLVMLPSGRRFDTTIIPLGTTRFLVVSDGGGSSFTSQLARTVAQTGASIDPSAQAAALQAEMAASAANSQPTQNQTCESSLDCPAGQSCMVTGPLIAGKPIQKNCYPAGQAAPQ